MLAEKDISTGIKDYLETLQAMGKLIYFRLNAGTFVMGKDTSYQRVIRGCKAGTSDFLVIRRKVMTITYIYSEKISEVIFLEVKKSDWNPDKKKTKTELAQEEFRKLVESQGHRYVIVRDASDVIKILGG